MVNYFGESAKTTPPSVFFPVFVRFIRAYKVRTASRGSIYVSFLTFLSWSDGKFPGLRLLSLRAEQGRDLAASVPQDVAYRPRPNNRKGQLGLTLELQLWCLDWFFPLLPSSPLPPDSLALPHHTTRFLRLFSVWIYGICTRKCAAQRFL